MQGVLRDGYSLSRTFAALTECFIARWRLGSTKVAGPINTDSALLRRNAAIWLLLLIHNCATLSCNSHMIFMPRIKITVVSQFEMILLDSARTAKRLVLHWRHDESSQTSPRPQPARQTHSGLGDGGANRTKARPVSSAGVCKIGGQDWGRSSGQIAERIRPRDRLCPTGKAIRRCTRTCWPI
jgi:hypothetical protein